MRRIALIITACAIIFGATTSSALDLKTALKNASDKKSGKSALGNALSGLLSSDDVKFNDMVGDWKYSSPCVKFKSSNVLKKAGGAAVTGTIEQKLEPYYKTAGITSMTLSISADSTFTMKVRGISLKGTISSTTQSDGANFVFSFKAVKKISLGKLNAYISKGADGTIDMAFDITKLVGLLEKVSSVSGSKSITAVSKLLSSYDGVCAGFRLAK